MDVCASGEKKGKTSKKITEISINCKYFDTDNIFIEFISAPDIIYCGQCLDDQKPLETYGLKDGVTLYLVRRYNKEPAKSPGTEMLNYLTFMKCYIET